MSDLYTCHFCKKTLASPKSLDNHQKSAKYCLSIQCKVSDKNKCNGCEKSFCNRTWLIQHQLGCTEYQISLKTDVLLKENKDLKLHIESIQQKELEKEAYYHTKLKEKEAYYEEKLKDKDEKLREKNEYIAKLEVKLEKFENVVVTNISHSSKSYEDEEEIPIPLGKKIDSIIIEEINDDVEYSNITLNNVVITSRPIDHYVNATQLCQAGEKKFSHWFSLETTKELINELSADAGIPASGLVETKRGGNDKSKQGSWIHPDLSIQLAQWISPKFAIQVSKWIRALFSDGSIEIDLSLMREKETEMREKDDRIKKLESVCLSKQRRVVYPERNVIYMLTTDDHLRRRTYIIGKAKNLTNRLSTYNKTCDHTVVHYRDCKNEDDMDTIETMVLNKLRSYREQANRDRFILPSNKDESFFTEAIDECVGFV